MPRKPKTRDDPDSRPAQILDQAITLIGERGYYGFTVQELATRCGLSNPGLLHYFPSKQHVLMAALEELETREARFMSPVVQSAEPGGERIASTQALLGVLRAFAARTTAQPQVARLLAQLQTEALNATHPAHRWWQTREADLLGFLVDLIGPFTDNPRSSARQTAAMMHGLSAQWLRADQGFDLVDEWERALAVLLAGWRAPPSRAD